MSILRAIETRPLFAAVVIAIAASIAYLPSFEGEFLFDDEFRILLDERLDPENSDWSDLLKMRRPLVTLSLAINYAIGKGELREPHDSWSYHLVNLVIHIGAALVLFGLVRRTLLRIERYQGRAANVALAAALLWAVHPLTTQSVTYMIQRAESGMALFYLLTLYFFARGIDSSQRSKLWFAGAVVAAGLGMGCKAVIVTVPVVLLAYDRIFVSRSFMEIASKRWGLYLGTVLSLVVLSNGLISTVLSAKEGSTSHVGFQFKGISPIDYLLTQPAVLLRYLQLSVWPSGLCLDYSWLPVDRFSQWGPPGLAILALLGLTGFGLWKRPRLAFLGLAFFVILAPTSSIVPIKDVIFEHRMYLPLAALVTALVVVLDFVIDRRVRGGQARSTLEAGLVGVVAVALMVTTFQRNQLYSSPIDMWSDVIETSPENGRAYINLGLAISKLNDPARLPEALGYLEKACFYAPEYVLSWQFRGKALYQLRRYSEAVPYLRTALAKEPKRPERYSRKRPAETRFLLGCTLAQLNRLDEAREELEAAVQQDEGRSLYWENLGSVAGRQRDFERAQEALVEAIALAPRDPDRPTDHNAITARVQLAVTYANLAQPKEELATLDRAKKLDPENLMVRENLVYCSLRAGDNDRARLELQFIRSRAPDSPVFEQAAVKSLLDSGG